jgi:hypothetical protein
MQVQRFKNSFSENIFRFKYAQGPNDTWDALCERLVEDVCGEGVITKYDRPLMSLDDRRQIEGNELPSWRSLPLLCR